MNRLLSEGFELTHRSKDGADNKKICFLQPKSTNGVLIEICQKKTSLSDLFEPHNCV